MQLRIHDYLDKQNDQRPTARALTDSIGTDWNFADLSAASIALAEEMKSKI